jgi:protein SCO1/2
MENKAMTTGRLIRVAQVVTLMAIWLGPTRLAQGHSLKALEDQLFRREPYVEIANRPAFDFALRDVAGRAVSLADFRGKVVVLWFIYAGCPDVCPLHSEAIARIQAAINQTPMRDLVQFVTVTTDPQRDTADVLKAYGLAHGLDPVNWVFLTSGPGRPTATRELAERYGLKFTAVKDGYQMHGIVTHLIDKSGMLRARYHGLKFQPTNLIVHVNALTNDDH